MKKLKIRLIGPEGPWREEKEQFVANKYNATILVKNENAKDSISHEVDLIRQADVVIVNAEQELDKELITLMTCAKEAGKAVVTILPFRLHVHEPRNGTIWIHPFFSTFSDLIVKSVHDLPEKLPKGFEQLSQEQLRELSREHKKLQRTFEKFDKWMNLTEKQKIKRALK